MFVSDAVNVIKEGENSALSEKKDEERFDYLVQGSAVQLLNHFADQKDEEKLQQVLNLLIDHKVVAVSSILFGPLIKMKLDQ